MSYSRKHNEANGEDNRDGNDDNRSFNCGAEGPSEASDVRALRAKQRRNLLATLLLSQGTPMLLPWTKNSRKPDDRAAIRAARRHHETYATSDRAELLDGAE